MPGYERDGFRTTTNPDGTCISSIAIDMAYVMLSTATDLAPRSRRPHGAQGWFVGPGVEAEMNAACCCLCHID